MRYTINHTTGVRKAWMQFPGDKDETCVAIFGAAGDLVRIGLLTPVDGYEMNEDEIVIVYRSGALDISRTYETVEAAKQEIESHYYTKRGVKDD